MSCSLWTGSIWFGMVPAPVRLFSATQSKELRFHFLDRRDLSPIGYDKVNKKTGSIASDDFEDFPLRAAQRSHCAEIEGWLEGQARQPWNGSLKPRYCSRGATSGV